MRRRVLALLVFGAFYFAVFPLNGQDANLKSPEEAELIAAKNANEADLGKKKTALLDLSSDLDGMAKSLDGADLSNALAIGRGATDGVTYLDATVWFLGLYDRMQCDADRAAAKTVLTNRLRFYSHMLDLAADRTNGNLAFARVPAIAQEGQRIRDDLRAAKNELDGMTASLNDLSEGAPPKTP